jgi:hypothetical protein
LNTSFQQLERLFLKRGKTNSRPAILRGVSELLLELNLLAVGDCPQEFRGAPGWLHTRSACLSGSFRKAERFF